MQLPNRQSPPESGSITLFLAWPAVSYTTTPHNPLELWRLSCCTHHIPIFFQFFMWNGDENGGAHFLLW